MRSPNVDLQQTSDSSGLGPVIQPLSWPVGSTTETSGGPELSDSLSSGGIVAQAPLRKVKVSEWLLLVCAWACVVSLWHCG